MKQFGIDISAWQGDYNLAQAKKEGVEFVVIKGAGGDDGLYKDRRFESNYAKAKSLGIPVGAYFFSYAMSINEAQREAEFFYQQCLKGKQFELPVYIDVENRTQLGIGKRALTDVIKAWCSYLEDKGFFVGIYSSESFFYSYMYDDELQRYAHWVANWSRGCGYACGLWQFGGSSNSIRSPYIAGQVTDQDYMFVDYPTIIKQGGFNGFSTSPAPSPTPTPSKKTVDELAREVIAGEWGNGQDRKERLTSAGYDYDAVQDRVNEILYGGSTNIQVGDTVTVTDPINYDNGKPFTLWYKQYKVMELSGDRAVIGVNGIITSAIDIKYLRKA